MRTIFRVQLVMLMSITFVVLSACAPKARVVQDDRVMADITGLELDESEAPTLVYRRPGAPGLGEFNRFIIDPVQVYYSDTRMEQLSWKQVIRMQQYLVDAMVRELSDAGYEVGTRSEAGTLRISFILTGLKAPTAAPNVTTALFPYALSVGDVTVEAVIRDGLTNRKEAVVVSRASGARWLNPSPWSAWADVQRFFDGWAKGFREAVDEAHGR